MQGKDPDQDVKHLKYLLEFVCWFGEVLVQNLVCGREVIFDITVLHANSWKTGKSNCKYYQFFIQFSEKLF